MQQDVDAFFQPTRFYWSYKGRTTEVMRRDDTNRYGQESRLQEAIKRTSFCRDDEHLQAKVLAKLVFSNAIPKDNQYHDNVEMKVMGKEKNIKMPYNSNFHCKEEEMKRSKDIQRQNQNNKK